MICSVCIATYKRPHLLRKLLRSLVNQIITDDVKLEIIIVDNDPEESAKFVYEEFSRERQFEFHYLIQPVKNISLTRNRAVKNAKGEFLLFIDDDEVASPEWVSMLLKTIKDFDADAVFGRVVSNFHKKTPEWVKKIYLFNRQCPATGTIAIGTRTGNCAVKASLLKNIPEPFDPTCGITGGEDTHLFEQLRQKGAKFFNCYEACVYEFVPLERTQFIWLLKRAFHGGNGYSKLVIDLAWGKKIIRLGLAITGICYATISLFFALIALPSNLWRTHWILKFAANLGKIFAVFGYNYQAYK